MAPIGKELSTVDLMPYDQFVESRFYREWVQPQNLVDSVGVVLDRSGTTAAGFAIFRHQRDGLVDDEARRRMQLIIPHVRRSALMGKVIDLNCAEATNFADVLDGINAGIFLLGATGRIVHVNTAGRALLTAAKVLRSDGGF